VTIVVTGAAGLIGRHLLPALSLKHGVCAVSRRSSPGASSQPGQPSTVSWLSADLAADVLPAGLPARADVVVHLAQSSHYREFPEKALDVFNVNVASTARLLDWSRNAGVRQFILASSGGIESGSRNYYLASKASAELLAESYSEFFTVTRLRFFFVYGLHQKPGMLVPRLINSIRESDEIALVGRDGLRLNPIAVADAVGAVVAAIDGNVSGQFDIGGPEVLTLRAMCETIARHLGVAARFTHDLTRVPTDIVGDISAMSTRLRAPRWRFDDGIVQMLAAQQGSAQ
jgi:UDP-glucose 4-epimerase